MLEVTSEYDGVVVPFAVVEVVANDFITDGGRIDILVWTVKWG